MKKLAIVLLFSFTYVLLGTIINIPADYSTITEGIFNAVDTDTVLVAPDTYYENLNFDGKNIVLASQFLITGDSSYIEQTIIDGDSLSNVVILNSGETEEAKLIGFTITNGYSLAGSGIYINGSSPEISNNIITNNNMPWYGEGSGIYLKRSSSQILDNTIEFNNGAVYGGGIEVDTCSTVEIKGNIIRDNITFSGYGVDYGGGIMIICSDNIKIEENLIESNDVAFGKGGAISMHFSTVSINKCTFYDTDPFGSTIFFSGGELDICNSIIWSDDDYEGVCIDTLEGTNSILAVSYSCLKDSTEGEGNITIDPMFDNFETFELQVESPCINGGDPTSELDPDGTVTDMGWRYFDDTGIENSEIRIQNYELAQNYPNPFNPNTTINFSIPQDNSQIKLAVYNVKGELVSMLFDGIKNVGKHSTTFDASNLNSGVYYYSLEVNGVKQATKKMVMIK
ncbi:MAG: T9SS type A sorting domain-containing protein [Candidatus Delongbacteria bacterium]|nr:T9SS type A sorting domain-containing protein [Candidatus Delongbacteria bacterium]